MSKFTSALAPIIREEQTFVQQFDVDNAPHHLIRIGGAVAVGLLLLAVPLVIAAIPAGMQLTVWYPDIPWTVAPVLAALGAVMLAVVAFIRFAERAKQAAIDGYATYLRIQRLQAEARLAEAQAKLRAATPPIIAETIRPVPVMTSRVTPDEPENRAENQPVSQFYKDIKDGIRLEDLRWFIRECLKSGEHSRPYWITRRKRAGTNIPPSGPDNAINSQPIYEKYMQVLVDNKLIINRDNGETGEWMTRSYKKICLVLGIGDGSDWEPEPEKPDLT